MKGRTGFTLSRTKYVKCFRVETSCYRQVLPLKFIVTVELLYDQAESAFVQCQTKMRAFASRIFSEFKQIELNWNRIVHQHALWGLVFWSGLLPDHETNESAHRMQVSLPARNRVTGRRSETFEDLWYLFSSEDKYKGFSLYQTEDWLIDWNQLQFWNGAGDEVARLRE